MAALGGGTVSEIETALGGQTFEALLRPNSALGDFARAELGTNNRAEMAKQFWMTRQWTVSLGLFVRATRHLSTLLLAANIRAALMRRAAMGRFIGSRIQWI